MGLPQDFSGPAPTEDLTSPLSKRCRFTPNSLPPIIPVSDNSSIETHTFSSLLLLQLCEQAPSQAEIEAGLLQVGMRVRKSVAEGYKTLPKRFTPRPFFNHNRLSPETQAALTNGNTAIAHDSSPFSPSQIQPMSTGTFSLWSYSTSHKRGYEADSDGEESQDWQPQTPGLAADAGMSMRVEYFAIDMETMSEISPLTRLGDREQQPIHSRRMAMPKSPTTRATNADYLRA